MTDEDVEVSREHGGGSFESSWTTPSYRMRLVESDPDAYDALLQRGREPDAVVHPALPLGPLERARHPPARGRTPTSRATAAVNEDLAEAVLEEVEGEPSAVVMLHDYHLYIAPKFIRASAPDLFLHHFVHIPWTQPDAWRVLPRRHPRGHLRGHPLERHHRLPHALLPAQLPALLPRAVRPGRGRGGRRGALRRPRRVGARLPAADLRRDLPPQRPAPGRPRVRARDPAPPARAPDPARGPRRPLEERPARLHRVRPLPRAAPRVPREGHVHRPPDPVAPGRARVRRVPGADRGAGGGREPPPRHAPTGCRSSCACARTSRRRSPPTSTTTC